MNYRHINARSLFLLISIAIALIPSPISSTDCARAQRDWLNYRYKAHVGDAVTRIFNQPICPIPNSCCDKSMELSMYQVGEREVSAKLASWIIPVADQLESDSVALNYFFTSDLTEARNRLHEAFSGIYGYNYKVNHAFFFQLFTDLEAYMAGRRGDLDQMLSNFFNQLRTSIVVLMEKVDQETAGSVASDSQRINCLSEALGKQNAFDQTDRLLRDQFLQAYPPARMLVNTLAAGSRLLRTIVEDASNRPECVVAYSRFQFCGVYCDALVGAKAEICPEVCTNFIKTCFSNEGTPSSDALQSLPQLWSKFIDAIILTTKRLERTQNFATVNKDLHIFLSEAITFVHQKYAQVKPSLMQECKSAGGGGGGGRSQPNFNLSPNSWSYNSRTRRRSVGNGTDGVEPDLARGRRQVGYPGGVWPPQPPPTWSAPGGQPQGPTPLNGAFQPYFQPNRRGRGGAHQPIQPQQHSSRQQQQQQKQQQPPTSRNTPEKLNKWASQLKSYYSNIKSLFDWPPTSVCAGAAESNHDCWNPQSVTPVRTDSGKPRRHLKDMRTVVDRLNLLNAKNNGDPDALEMGARFLAEARVRNTTAATASTTAITASGDSSHQGPPSLLQPRNPEGQPSHDPWRIGGTNYRHPPQPPVAAPSAGMENFYPGVPYQQPGGPAFTNPVGGDVVESGFNPAEMPPHEGYPPPPGPPTYPSQAGKPGYGPSHVAPPDLAPPTAPPHAPQPNPAWPGPEGPDNSESSGFNVGEERPPWSPVVNHQRPDTLGPWEPPPPPSPPPSPPLPPVASENEGHFQWPPDYLPEPQGSGENDLPGPEAYPQPPAPPSQSSTLTTTMTTTTTTPQVTTMSRTEATTTTSEDFIPISTDPPITTQGTPVTSEGAMTPSPVVNTTAASPAFPSPPLPSPSVNGLDDEDFEQPISQSQPLPTSTQRPWDMHPPPPSFGYESSGQFLGGGGGEEEAPGGVVPSLIPQGGAPDCSAEAIARAGSGVDPRCLSEAGPRAPQQPMYPHGSQDGGWEPHSPNLEDTGAGSGWDGVGGLEPPPPPQPHYPDYPGPTHTDSEPFYGGLPNYGDPTPKEKPFTPMGSDRETATTKPSTTIPTPRVLPPDIWLPDPALEPGDGKVPDSDIFRSDFPLFRGRPVLGDSTVTTGGIRSTTSGLAAVISTLTITAIWV